MTSVVAAFGLLEVIPSDSKPSVAERKLSATCGFYKAREELIVKRAASALRMTCKQLFSIDHFSRILSLASEIMFTYFLPF